MPSRTAHIDTLDQESVDPQHEQPASDLSSAPSKPRRSKRAAVVVEHASPTSAPTAEHAVTNKRRKRSASAPRTLSKEELADYIARGEFWQKCEAAEGEGDGYQDGRGDGGGDPVYEDCNEIRRKIAAFLNGGRMTQTAWCKLLGVGSSSYQHFMKARVSGDGALRQARIHSVTATIDLGTHSQLTLCATVYCGLCGTTGSVRWQRQRRVPCCRSLLRELAHTGTQAEVSEAEEGGGGIRQVWTCGVDSAVCRVVQAWRLCRA